MCKLCDAEGVLTGELERVILENREDNHNKMYTVWVEQVEGGYQVKARWGPIGGWAKSMPKSDVLYSMVEAGALAYALYEKKTSRGYRLRVCKG